MKLKTEQLKRDTKEYFLIGFYLSLYRGQVDGGP